MVEGERPRWDRVGLRCPAPGDPPRSVPPRHGGLERAEHDEEVADGRSARRIGIQAPIDRPGEVERQAAQAAHRLGTHLELPVHALGAGPAGRAGRLAGRPGGRLVGRAARPAGRLGGRVTASGFVERLGCRGRLVEDQADGPDVGCRGELVAGGLFGGHVGRCPPTRRSTPGGVGQAQVDDLGLARLGHDVPRLEIEVEDVATMEVVEGGTELLAQRGQGDERVPCPALPDQGAQRVAGDRLHRHHRAGPVDHLVAADEVRMMQRRQQLALPGQATNELRVGQSIGAQRLDDAAGLERRAPGVVDVEVVAPRTAGR